MCPRNAGSAVSAMNRNGQSSIVTVFNAALSVTILLLLLGVMRETKKKKKKKTASFGLTCLLCISLSVFCYATSDFLVSRYGKIDYQQFVVLVSR